MRDNIALTAPDATSAEIEAAARVACAHDFIMELPKAMPVQSVSGQWPFREAASAHRNCQGGAPAPKFADP